MEPLSRPTPEVPANVTNLQAFREHIAKEGLANHAEIMRQRRDIRTAQQYLALTLGHPLSFATDLTSRLMSDFIKPSTSPIDPPRKEKTHKIIRRAHQLLERGYTEFPIEDDPYDDLFNEAFAVLSERRTHLYAGERLSQQEQALMILRQFHRITLQNPVINTRSYPRIPSAIERILDMRDSTPPPQLPPQDIS